MNLKLSGTAMGQSTFKLDGDFFDFWVGNTLLPTAERKGNELAYENVL